MKLNKTYSQFFGDLTTVAKQAMQGKDINIAVLFMTEDEDFRNWAGTRMNPLYIESVCDNCEAIGQKAATESYEKAVERYDEDMKLVYQGVFETHDVGYNIIDMDNATTAVYYDFCERVDMVMASISLGRAVARLAVVMSCPNGDAKDTFAAQEAVCAYIRGFLSKNSLGTTTDIAGWGGCSKK